MRNHAIKFASLLTMLLATTLLVPQRAAADEDDPPGRVARLSDAEGSVSFEPAGTDDWVDTVVNRPLTTGDKLWSDRNSRAELQLGSATIRMGSNTGFSFLDLNDNIVQLQLTAGTLRIRVRRLERDEQFEIDTPNLAFSISRPGIYRINVNEGGDQTMVEVRNGEGNATGGGQSFDLRSGESGSFYGTDQLSADIGELEGDDDFEYWCDERDRREDHSVSRRYVAEDAVGYEDLDDYGGWRDTSEYGTVWFPHTTIVGWAPYRYGHWVYIYPWGYTWVDDEPWGFAPFHYGRWVVAGGVWGWVPCRPPVVGVAYVRPVYAPALVAWVGGPHFAIGVGVGGAATVGWFPLGPREVYVPSYHVSRTYINNVNITNTTVNTTVINNYYNTTVVNNNTTITNVKYVNQTVPGAVTAAPARAVATAQPIGRNMVHVDERHIGSAPVVVKAPPVAPERQAVLGAGRTATVRPPAEVAARPVVAKTTPPPPPPRFETQQTLIKQNGGQPPAISQVRQVESRQARETVPVRMAPPARPGTPQQNAANRTVQPQENRQPAANAPPNNRPANVTENNQGAANDRPFQNAQSNRPQNNEQPGNRPAYNPPANNPPANNQRQYSDRPPAARPSNTQPIPSPNQQQLEQRHQQELENIHRQQDQQRQQLEQRQQQESQQLQQQRADQQRQQQLQQQHQQQLQDLQRQHQEQQQQVYQRQQQEHQQQRQQDRPQPQSRPQAAPQEHSRPAEKSQPQSKERPSKP